MAAIGIDLGTANIRISIYKDGKVIPIPNSEGGFVTPNCLSFTDDGVLVGGQAKSRATRNPESTIFNAKSYLGKSFESPTVQALIAQNASNRIVVEEGTKPAFQVSSHGDSFAILPEDVLVRILRAAKTSAELFLGTEVARAVVSVPVCFNRLQRKMINDAASKAGFICLRVVNDISLLAVDYFFEVPKRKDFYKVLFVDIGASNVSVAAIELNGDAGILELLALTGTPMAAGEEITSRLMGLLQAEMAKRGKAIDVNKRAFRRLKAAYEDAKCQLSYAAKAPIVLESLIDDMDFSSHLTRDQLASVSTSLFQDVIDQVDSVLRAANLSKSDIFEIVISGDTCQSPIFQQMLVKFFNGKDLFRRLLSENAVASGAAVIAAILSRSQDQRLNTVLLLDMAPHAFGVEISGGAMNRIIQPNTTIPVKKIVEFTTSEDNQSSVLVELYEGNSALTRDNTLLDRISIPVDPAPKGIPKIEIRLDFDANSIMTLTVSVEGKPPQSIIVGSDPSRLTRPYNAAPLWNKEKGDPPAKQKVPAPASSVSSTKSSSAPSSAQSQAATSSSPAARQVTPPPMSSNVSPPSGAKPVGTPVAPKPSMAPQPSMQPPGYAAAVDAALPENVEAWKSGHVSQWLSTIEMGEYLAAFFNNKIDGVMLLSGLGDSELGVLGVTNMFHRRKILLHIDRLRTSKGTGLSMKLNDSSLNRL